jgi:hypothetical protein
MAEINSYPERRSRGGGTKALVRLKLLGSQATSAGACVTEFRWPCRALRGASSFSVVGP